MPKDAKYSSGTAEGPAPDAGAPEIEVTPAMVEAGVAILGAFDTTFEGEAVWAERVYRAMNAVRPRERADGPRIVRP